MSTENDDPQPGGSQVRTSPSPDALLHNGLEAHRIGNRRAAREAYEQVLAVDRLNAPAIHFLGMLAHQEGRSEEAAGLVRRSIELAPDVASFRANLGVIFGQMRRPAEAANCLREAARLDPKSAGTLKNFGVALEAAGQYVEAAAAYAEALRLSPKPDYEAHRVRALAQANRAPSAGELPAIDGESAAWSHTLTSLEYIYETSGRLEDAIGVQRRLISLRPESAAAHSCLLFLLLHQSGLSAETLCEEHRSWDRLHGTGLRNVANPPDNDRTLDRPLRVGYVSPDFRNHNVPRFTEPLIQRHDREFFAVVCYSDAKRTDSVTERIRGSADLWRETGILSAEQLLSLIRSDHIDILVDLAGHMAGNRMLTFARRAAPIQLSYQYPHATGLSTMDGRITDEWLDPPGKAEAGKPSG